MPDNNWDWVWQPPHRPDRLSKVVITLRQELAAAEAKVTALRRRLAAAEAKAEADLQREVLKRAQTSGN